MQRREVVHAAFDHLLSFYAEGVGVGACRVLKELLLC